MLQSNGLENCFDMDLTKLAGKRKKLKASLDSLSMATRIVTLLGHTESDDSHCNQNLEYSTGCIILKWSKLNGPEG